jgi:hypothetical protein
MFHGMWRQQNQQYHAMSCELVRSSRHHEWDCILSILPTLAVTYGKVIKMFWPWHRFMDDTGHQQQHMGF